MTRLTTIFVVLCAVVCQLGAQAPQWIYDEQRKALYPEKDYFCGFVIGEQNPGETAENATQRLKDKARAEAISTIEMTVEQNVSSNMESRLVQTAGDYDEQVVEQFQSSLKTSISMQIQGMNTEAWQALKSTKIYAFAYVSKKELVKKLKKQIIVANAQIEYELDEIDKLIVLGQKAKAKKNAHDIFPKFGDVQTAQKTLMAVDGEIDDDELQLTETNALKSRLLNICTSLEHAISVNIIVENDSNENVNIRSLEKMIAGRLSEEGYNFVENEEDDTDFRIQFSLEERYANAAQLGGITSYTAYVDVNFRITKMMTSQVVYMDKFNIKGVSTVSYDSALEAAYKDVVKIISHKIKTEIEK